MSKQNRALDGTPKGPGSPERSADERSEAARSAGEPGPRAAANGNEVRPRRRRFSAAFKLRILKEADACREQGQLGSLLRREGLYSSHLAAWRKQRDEGTGIADRKRGPKPRPVDHTSPEMAQLRRENAKLKLRLKRAEGLIELQKKLSDLMETATWTERSFG